MEAGSRVKISGVVSRPDLDDTEGLALYFVPPASRSAIGRYLVKVDGSNEEIAIQAENLAACTHVEEVTGDMVTVNGLCYCRAHRLEICGACTYDFRVMNRMRQLAPGDDIYERAEQVDADEAARNDPPLCALSKHTGRAPAPARAAHVNNKALPPRGLNPSTLADWPEDGTPDPATGHGPLEEAFVGAFSFREKIMSQQPHGKPSPADDPLYHVKESMVVMARHCDKFRGKEPIPRISLQDEAQSELIFIDVIGVKVIPGPADHVTGERDVVPAIVVRYSYFTASNRQAMMDSFSGMVAMKVQHDVAMGYTREASERSVSNGANMPSHKAEIATARSILDSSRQRLHPEWVRRESEGLAPNWSVSVLLPVTKEAEEPAPEKEVCAGCGASAGVKLLSCARCKTQRYCSKECQVACWKVHKKVCVAPEDAHANLLMVVDLEVDVMASLGLPGMHSWSINHDASTANKKNFMVGGGKSKKGAPQDDGMFVVKIQVPLAGGASMGLMCYNQKRNIHTYILTANCAGAQRLASIIRTGGVAGGMKGYFNAYTTDAGKKLCILAGKPLPLQPW